jgi:hypothetical protein
VNVAKDVAFCRACDRGFPLSDLVREQSAGPVDLANPPRGCWYRDDGGEVSIGASLRSVGGVIAVLFFAAFWNGISWTIFVGMLLGSKNVSGTGITHSNGQTVVSGVAYLFISPFLLVGLLVLVLVPLALFGRTEVVIRGPDGSVFTGVGAVGRRRRFDVAAVTGVAIRPSGWTKNNQPQYAISLEGPSPIKFGSGLPDAKREFIAAALRKVLG